MIAATRASSRKNGATVPATTRRVAIYTRQSVADDLEFGSLQAQREAAECYVKAQASLGWVVLPERYDDHGFSGGTIERPAFRRLLKDVEDGKVDIVAVHRLDRLSRSIGDFVRVMELLAERGVSFVAATQAFDTGTSLGRMTVNLLATFAAYERDLIRERTHEKMAATRRKGMWTGGPVPLGYSLVDRKLVVNEPEAERVREIYAYFLEHRSIMATVEELNRRGWTTKSNKPWDTSAVRRLLRSAVYSGQVEYQGELYPGAHQAIVAPETWSAACDALRDSIERHRAQSTSPALLGDVLRCGVCGSRMLRHFSQKRGRRFQSYVCARYTKRGAASCPGSRVPLATIEAFVVEKVRGIGRDPSLVAATIAAAERDVAARGPQLVEDLRKLGLEERRMTTERANLLNAVSQGGADIPSLVARLKDVDTAISNVQERVSTLRAEIDGLENHVIDEQDLRAALESFTPIWNELFPKERARILQLLVERIEFHGAKNEVTITFRPEGVRSLAQGGGSEKA